MQDRFGRLRADLERAVFDGPGSSDAALRRAIADGGALPAALAGLVAKIQAHAYQVTDDDLAALARAGFDDDQLFEISVSAALGAARVRFQAARAALAAAEDA